MRTIKYGYLIAILLSFLLAGLVGGFRFSQEVHVNVHDTYVTLSITNLMISFFPVISLLIFFTLAVSTRFRNMKLIVTLIIHNLLVILGTIYILYLSVAIVAIQESFRLFLMTVPDSSTSSNIKTILIAFTTITVLLSIGEVMLIKVAWKLRAHEKAKAKDKLE